MGTGLVARLRAGKGKISLGGLSLQTETLRQGAWMFAATVVSGGLAYLANTAVGRLLAPSQYSVYTVMISLMLIFGAAMNVIQTVTASHVAQLQALDRGRDVGELLVFLLRRLLPWGCAAMVLLWLAGRPVADLLRLPNTTTLWVMATVLVPLVLTPVAMGGLRGLERFGALGINLMVQDLLRLLASVGLILAGWGAVGAVASLPLSRFAIALLSLVWLKGVLRTRNREFKPDLSGILGYAVYAAVGLAAFTALVYMDVLIVKIRFTPHEAGLYSAVATLGRITLYLPSAIGVLLLPKVTAQDTRSEQSASALYKSLLIVGVLCGMVTMLFFLFPSPLVRLLFGPNYVAQASLLGPYGLAMTLCALANIWLVYYLAVRRQGYSYAVLCVAVVQALVLSALPLSQRQVVTTLIVGGGVLNLIGVLILKREQRIGDWR